MSKTFAALTAILALAVASPALAKPEAKTSTFTHEGVTYTYSISKAGRSTIYEGFARPGQKFRFVKRGDQVTGVANGISVSFRMHEVMKQTGTLTLASR